MYTDLIFIVSVSLIKVHYDINNGYEENIFKKERFPLNKYFYFIFKNKPYPTSDFAQV